MNKKETRIIIRHSKKKLNNILVDLESNESYNIEVEGYKTVLPVKSEDFIRCVKDFISNQNTKNSIQK